MRIDHLVNGKAVAGDNYFETINPATQEVLAEVACGGAKEVDMAVRAAKQALPAWAGRPAKERATLLRKLAELIDRHVPELAETESRDTGQVIAQTRNALVPRAAYNFEYFAELCTRVNGHSYPNETHLNYTLYHPVGVCALISPWNVPFMTATWKTAPCLAFGNTAVLKMSELSPLTASRLGELALEAGIPPGVFNVVHGYGSEAGEALISHPDVRAISFTGSTVTGNHIVKTAGLKKFSMELGGKSPFVIFADADFERALDAAVFMIFSNNGERCTAGSRILVERSIYPKFAARFVERFFHAFVDVPDFAMNVVVANGNAHRVRAYRHALDEDVRVVAHDVAVFESARLALVRVADQILRACMLARHEAPLQSGRKARAAQAAQRRVLHDLGDLLAAALARQAVGDQLVAAGLLVGGEVDVLPRVRRRGAVLGT